MSSSPRKILIPVDASKHSERAVEWFLKNGFKEGDHIYLFHSIEMPAFPYMAGAGGGAFPVDEWKHEVSRKFKEVEALKKKYQELLASHKASGELLAEEPLTNAIGEHVVKAAKAKEVNFIVIGSRGQGLVRRTLLGSVSDYVLHHTHIPVAIVPPEH